MILQFPLSWCDDEALRSMPRDADARNGRRLRDTHACAEHVGRRCAEVL
jgi:hypothetical protein